MERGKEKEREGRRLNDKKNKMHDVMEEGRRQREHDQSAGGRNRGMGGGRRKPFTADASVTPHGNTLLSYTRASCSEAPPPLKASAATEINEMQTGGTRRC